MPPTLYNSPMRLWQTPEGTIPSILSRSNRQTRWALPLSLFLLLCFSLGYGSSSLIAGQPAPGPLQRPKHASGRAAGARCRRHGVLRDVAAPPEGSREADRVIQSVIQFQSAFAKGTDRSVQDFAHRAVADKYGEEAASILERFRAEGWTAEILDALADADQRASAEELERLAAGFGPFNLSVDDFRRFMQLVRDGRSALAARGQYFDEVYARHRRAMPGAPGR